MGTNKKDLFGGREGASQIVCYAGLPCIESTHTKPRRLNSCVQFSLRVRTLRQFLYIHQKKYGFRSLKHRIDPEFSCLHFHISSSAIAKPFSFTRESAQVLFPAPLFHSVPTRSQLNSKSDKTVQHRVSYKLKTLKKPQLNVLLCKTNTQQIVMLGELCGRRKILDKQINLVEMPLGKKKA